jgi:hypothetical protein
VNEVDPGVDVGGLSQVIDGIVKVEGFSITFKFTGLIIYMSEFVPLIVNFS